MEIQEIGRLLGEVPLFFGIEREILWKFAERMEQIRVPKDATVFSEGTPGDDLLFIVSGRVGIEVKIADAGGEPRPVVVREMGAGEPLGEGALLTGKERAATALAQTDLELLRLSRADFESLCAEDPREGMKLFRNLAIALSEKVRETGAIVRRSLLELRAQGTPELAGERKKGILSLFGL